MTRHGIDARDVLPLVYVYPRASRQSPPAVAQRQKKSRVGTARYYFFGWVVKISHHYFQLSRLPNAKFVSCRKSPLYHLFRLVPRAATTAPTNATANDCKEQGHFLASGLSGLSEAIRVLSTPVAAGHGTDLPSPAVRPYKP